jgi:hypothetical protein
MKWDLTDTKEYAKHQYFVDTALIPLVQVRAGQDMYQTVQRATWLSGIANSLEEQLKGRILLFPMFTYTGLEETNHLMSTVSTYFRSVREEGFSYVIGISLDDVWLDREASLTAKIICPAMPSAEEQTSDSVSFQKLSRPYMTEVVKMWNA